jgi:hypothetical protein
MTEYFNEAAYNRWARQYELNAANFVSRLNVLHLALDNLPQPLPEYALSIRENIEKEIDDIEEKLTEATPRNFTADTEPLTGWEKFSENFKVLVNLICKLIKKDGVFSGIYKTEKERVLKIHQTFQFKEKVEKVSKAVDDLMVDQEAYQKDLNVGP